MNLVSKYGYIDKLDDTVNKYNNIYYSTIKMKPLEVNSGPYVGFGIENNNKDPTFKNNDPGTISKDENIFAVGYVPN